MAESISSITPALSWENFVNYKPNLNRDQGYDSERAGRDRHGAIDYGSGAKVTLGTPITSVLSGTATPIYGYYPQNNPKDSGVVVSGKDPKGRNVEITYGHLSRASVRKLFNNGNGPISVKSGDVLGTVDKYGAVARNEPHVHVKVFVDGKRVNPLTYFKELSQYRSNTTSNNNSTVPVQSNNSNENVTNTEKPDSGLAARLIQKLQGKNLMGTKASIKNRAQSSNTALALIQDSDGNLTTPDGQMVAEVGTKGKNVQPSSNEKNRQMGRQ
jgi:Peptidase family M23